MTKATGRRVDALSGFGLGRRRVVLLALLCVALIPRAAWASFSK
jgi:hypothetical protein